MYPNASLTIITSLDTIIACYFISGDTCTHGDLPALSDSELFCFWLVSHPNIIEKVAYINHKLIGRVTIKKKYGATMHGLDIYIHIHTYIYTYIHIYIYTSNKKYLQKKQDD